MSPAAQIPSAPAPAALDAQQSVQPNSTFTAVSFTEPEAGRDRAPTIIKAVDEKGFLEVSEAIVRLEVRTPLLSSRTHSAIYRARAQTIKAHRRETWEFCAVVNWRWLHALKSAHFCGTRM